MNDEQRRICEQLWVTYEPKLRAFCRGKLKDYETDAEEALSETFLALCRKIELEGKIDYPQAWLYKVLKNIIAQKYRTINIDSEYRISLYEIYDMLIEPSPEEKLEKEEFASRLSEILNNNLNETEKRTFIALFYEEKSIKEFAKTTNSNPDAVKQKRHRLKIKIFKFLKTIE